MHRHLKMTSMLLVYFALVVITPCKASFTRINDSQKSYFVPLGGAADFDCILSDPKVKVELYLGNKHMVTDGVKVAEVGQIFTVYNITNKDSGYYRCKARDGNDLKKSYPVGSIRAFSIVNLDLKFHVSPKIETALEGESASFTCQATSSKFAAVSWYDGMKEKTNQNKSRNGNKYTSVLTVSDLDNSDSGIYHCHVKVQINRHINLDITGYFPTQAELIVKPFEFTSRHHTVFVGDIGSSLTISCNNTDPIASTSLWIQRSHQNFQQVRPDGVRVIQDGSQFVIHRVTIQDGGRYTCRAVSTYGKTISMDMGRFIVLQGGYRDPKAYISPHTKNLNLDKTFNFTCQAFGDSINFTWFKDSSIVPPDMVTVLPRRQYKGYTMFESILTIRNAERSDEGRYTCQITSAVQPGYSHSFTANLTIYECPKANGKFRDPFNNTLYIECVNGTGTRIECPFPGQYWEDSIKNCVFPPTTPTTPVLTWISDRSTRNQLPFEGSFVFDCRLTDSAIPVRLQKEGNPVIVDGTKVKLVGQKFTISKLHIGDSADYTCHANNVGNPKIFHVTVNPDLTLELSVFVIGGANSIELETSFNRSIKCESLNEGRMYWYKVDPSSKKLTLITIGPLSVLHSSGNKFTWAFLSLSNVIQKDAGMYMCYKNNSVGAVANTTIEILVKAPVKPKLSTSSLKPIKEHDALQFNVAVSGSPFPDVTWYKGRQALVTCRGGQSFKCQSKHNNYKIDDRINILNRGSRTVLNFKIINPLHPADNGEHRIKVQNLAGEDQATFNVSIIVPPKIKKKNNEVVKEMTSKNSPYTLVCEVPRAVPSPVFTWKYQVLSCTGSKKCQPNPTKWRSIPVSVAKVRKTTSLRSVLRALPTDKLIYYRCAVRNTAGYDKKDFALHRTNFIQELTIEGEKVKLKDEHKNITMTCRALKAYVGHPTWRDGDNRQITNTSRFRITFRESSTEYSTHLQIFYAQINDSGTYTCEATKDDKKQDNTSTILKVFAVSPPSITIGNLTANETKHVSLNCTVSGHPSPTVTWFKAGKLLETKVLSSLSECSSRLNDFYLHVYASELGKPRMHSLVICNARSDNSGWYTCKARNSINETDGKAYLNVQAPPTVTLIREQLHESFQSERLVVIRCHATGNPIPHVRWLKKNENGSFVTLANISSWKLGNSTLFLSELKNKNHGIYRCIAKNALGQTDSEEYPINPPVVQRIKRPDSGAVSKPALIAIVVSGSLVILLLLVIIAVLYRRKKLYGGFYILTLPPMPDYIKKLDPSRTLQEQTHKLPLSADWEFSRNRLTLGKVIGSGAFGQVFIADAVGIVAFDPRSSMRGKGTRRRSRFGSMKSPYYNNKQVTTVACKGLKEDATESEFRDLVSELKILMHIGEHKNIVNLLGACTKGRECDLLVIIEFCPHGNLLEFLRKRRDLFEAEWAPATEKAEERFSTTDLVITAFQVSRAMEFLASRRCVHRDLAARNVLVGENYVMKVADFGLARDIYKDEHYVKTTAGLLPVKWMAIEALVDRIYTHQSDVWSFGVLLWEIFTLGGSPYPGLPANEVYQYLMEGQRMEQPHDCPHEIYALMLGCWEHDPSRRPPFSAIVQAIDNLLAEKTTQTGEEYLELENEQDVNESQPYYLEPEEIHPLSSPVFDSPQGSPLPPIPVEEIEMECLIKEDDYLNKNDFVFNDLPKGRARNNGAESCEMDKVRADSMEKENHKKSESSGNMSDEDEFISEKEHLMKNYDDEKDVCERNSGVFDTPTPYINTRPYANVNNFIKNYGNEGATSKKEDDFRPRQQSARYV